MNTDERRFKSWVLSAWICVNLRLKSRFFSGLALLAASGLPCSANSFAPLTAAEIRTTARMIRSYGRVQGAPPATARFALIALAEPPKELVLRGASVGRAAFAVVYDPPSNRTWEAIANLAEYHVDSFKEIPGAQPAITGQDSAQADRLVRADPRWRRALQERGITELNSVAVVAWSAGYFALPGTNQGRIVRALSYYAAGGANIDAHPVEGVVAEVDLTAGRIIEMLDT